MIKGKTRHTLVSSASGLLLAGLLAVGIASPAMAGNIVLTGHDDELHADSSSIQALKAATNFVRNGSSLQVLAIDRGTQLGSALTAAGITFTSVDPFAVTSAMFDHSIYSAFVVASVETCGGCDNPVGTGTHLATFEPAIINFFNAGGGIFGLTEASDTHGFDYVPEATAGTQIFDSNGFALTPAASGIPGFVAVNGDQTHNTFSGFGSFYQVAEVRSSDSRAVTIFGSGGTIGCTGASCTITGGVPEPASWALMMMGFGGLGAVLRSNRRRAHLAVAA